MQPTKLLASLALCALTVAYPGDITERQGSGQFEARSVEISSSPPRFSSYAEYETFYQNEKNEAPQQCSETNSPADCQRCVAVTIGAWGAGLLACGKSSGNLNTPEGKAQALSCSIGVTALYWVSKIKCFAV